MKLAGVLKIQKIYFEYILYYFLSQNKLKAL